MPNLDVFRSDAFSLVSLTAAVLKAPYKPGRIGASGLFRERGIATTTVVVEEKDGRLSLIQTSPRGGPPTTIGQQKRTARPFIVPHLERMSTVLADEVQNVRAFGSENAEQAVQEIVNERLADLRSMHEVTLEHMRIGAIKGVVIDADGSTLFDLFSEFGVEQQTATLDVGDTADIRNQAVAIQRQIEYALGAEPLSSFRAYCGDDFFDALVGATSVKAALQYQESALLRGNLRQGFEFGGITWENYRGRMLSTSTPFFPDDEAYVVPEGTSLFNTYFAPADFVETVNTLGLPIYAKQAPDPEFNRWVKILTQSNPLALCLRPRAVVKVTLGT